MSNEDKKETPEDSHILDLDAAAAARRETKGKAPTLRWKGRTYSLPVELPYSMIDFDSQNDVTPSAMLKAILGDVQFEDFRKGSPSIDDVDLVFEWVNKEYGVSVGK